MENEIKVGEYVRSLVNGGISKVLEVSDLLEEPNVKYYKTGKFTGFCSTELYNVKHSPNLIDLIEVGDMVHTKDVLNEDWYWMFDEEMVKATKETIEEGIDLVEIVTKEMMKSISYKVKQEEK